MHLTRWKCKSSEPQGSGHILITLTRRGSAFALEHQLCCWDGQRAEQIKISFKYRAEPIWKQDSHCNEDLAFPRFADHWPSHMEESAISIHNGPQTGSRPGSPDKRSPMDLNLDWSWRPGITHLHVNENTSPLFLWFMGTYTYDLWVWHFS